MDGGSGRCNLQEAAAEETGEAADCSVGDAVTTYGDKGWDVSCAARDGRVRRHKNGHHCQLVNTELSLVRAYYIFPTVQSTLDPRVKRKKAKKSPSQERQLKKVAEAEG